MTPDPDDDIAPTPRDPSRALAVILALVAVGCLLAACFSHRWLADSVAGDVGYSPVSYLDCRASPCTTISNFQAHKNSQDSPFYERRIGVAFPVSGVVAFVALLMAVGGLVAGAGIAAANRRPDLPVSPTTFAFLGAVIGLVSGCVFVATGAAGSVGLAWSFWAFGIGSVAGIAGAQLLARQIRPSDPDLLHDAMNPDRF